MSVEDRVTKLETINELHMNKVVEGLDSLSILLVEADNNKKFRIDFESKVKNIIDDRLNTTKFDESIKRTIEKEVIAIFDKQEVRDDFTSKVQKIFKLEINSLMLGLYIKLSIIVGTIATTLATAILKGML